MKINQKGRSMVEMLGVLAIIGVLSAGGLAGYSKAMFQHKVNETVNTFSQVLQRFIELKSKDLGEGFEIRNADDMIKYRLFENCQKISDYSCKVPLGKLFVESYDNSSSIGVFFTSFKECIAFASVHWENAVPIEWWNTHMTELVIEGPGDRILYNKEANMSNLTIEDITEACQEQCEEGDCGLTLRLGF